MVEPAKDRIWPPKKRATVAIWAGRRFKRAGLNAILAFDRRTEFHRITVPTLVVGADDDLLAPRYFSEEYVRLIPGARAHFATRGAML
jgi:pimeloyl-ACP methyl ester carboxylesterase